MISTARRMTYAPQFPTAGTSISADPGALESNVSLVTATSARQTLSSERFEVQRGGSISSAPRTVGGLSLPRGTTVGAKFSVGPSAVGWANATAFAAVDLPARSQVIAEWHGQVIAVEQSYFIAELKGTIGVGVAGSLEEAQIPRDEVRQDDRDLLREGAFFRLCVNWELVNGSRRRVTDIVFRRMPAYRRDELEDARKAAVDLFHALRVE